MMPNYETLKLRLKSLASPYSRQPIKMLRRIYCDEPSFELLNKREIEFEIKNLIADHFEIGFNDILICGSAQTGFSASKRTVFDPASSDLDLSVVNAYLFQKIWSGVVDDTKAFTLQHLFPVGPGGSNGAIFVENMIARKGLMHGHMLPSTSTFDGHRKLLNEVSKIASTSFSKVTCSFYINERAFHFKQMSFLKESIK